MRQTNLRDKITWEILLILLLLNTSGFNCSDLHNQTKEVENLAIVAKKIFYKHRHFSTQEADIYLGVTPWASNDKMVEMYRPFSQYLSEKMGKNIDLCISPTYDQLQDDLADGSIDLAIFSPAAFAKAIVEIKNSLIYLASYIKKGKGYYHGYIIVRKDSPYKSFSDLEKKYFAFVSQGSASGYKFPMALFLKQKINPYKYFKSVKFSGSHSKVIREVKTGVVDAGATWEGAYESAVREYGDIFRIIKKTDKIPFDGFAASKKSKKINPEFIKKFIKLLSHITIETKTEKGQPVFNVDKGLPYTGFVSHDLSFYNVIIETQKLINEFEQSNRNN